MASYYRPYIEWNPRYERWSIFHNGGIQAFARDNVPLVFTDLADACKYLAKIQGEA